MFSAGKNRHENKFVSKYNELRIRQDSEMKYGSFWHHLVFENSLEAPFLEVLMKFEMKESQQRISLSRLFMPIELPS